MGGWHRKRSGEMKKNEEGKRGSWKSVIIGTLSLFIWPFATLVSPFLGSIPTLVVIACCVYTNTILSLETGKKKVALISAPNLTFTLYYHVSFYLPVAVPANRSAGRSWKTSCRSRTSSYSVQWQSEKKLHGTGGKTVVGIAGASAAG